MEEYSPLKNHCNMITEMTQELNLKNTRLFCKQKASDVDYTPKTLEIAFNVSLL
jgi:hypothetical protein